MCPCVMIRNHEILISPYVSLCDDKGEKFFFWKFWVSLLKDKDTPQIFRNFFFSLCVDKETTDFF